mgnify:CR=1 FL=1
MSLRSRSSKAPARASIAARMLPRSAQAVTLQPGQTTRPLKVQDRIFIVRLDEYEPSGCKSFYEVQHLIEQQLIFLYQQQQYNEFVDKLVKKTDLAQMERFTNFCASQAYNRWGRDS